MKDPEERLQGIPLAEPSDAFQRKMTQLLDGAPQRRSGLLKRPVALWQCAAACIVFAMAGVWLGQAFRPQQAERTALTERVYYIYDSSGPPPPAMAPAWQTPQPAEPRIQIRGGELITDARFGNST